MTKVKKIFTPSTNLTDDIGNKSILDNIVVTNQIIRTLKLFGRKNEEDFEKNSAVSIVGPYGSGKSTTALVLYHYLTNTLPQKLQKDIEKNSLELFKHTYNSKEVKVIVGRKTSLELSLKRLFNIRKSLTKHIQEDINNKDKRLLLIIDEFGKYLEYSSDDPKNGDVYLLQQLAEMASRSDGLFKIITIRHQSIMGYFSSLKGSYLNEWKKIQGRFYEIVHSNTIEDTLSLVSPHIDRWSNKEYKSSSLVLNYLKNNPAIGDISKLNILNNSYPFHPFALLLLISAYKRFAQNERSVFTFLNTNERFSIKDFLNRSTKDVYRLCDFYDYIFLNLEHYIIESPFYQDWNKIETALRDLKSAKNRDLVNNFQETQELIKTIGMLDLFGNEIGLKADDDTLTASMIKTSKIQAGDLVNNLIKSLHNENIITYNNYHGGSYHLWHGAHTNINELINNTIEEQKGSLDIAKNLERLAPNDPLIAKKHLIYTGTFRSIELRYISFDDLEIRKNTDFDGVIYLFITNNKEQKEKLITQLQKYEFNKDERCLVLFILPKLERYIREYIAAAYIEQNNEQLKTDKVGKEELDHIKYHLSQSIESIIRNHEVLNVKMFWVDGSIAHQVNYRKLSTEKVNDWIDGIYSSTPIIKNELVNQSKPSPSAMTGVKRLLTEMIYNSHIKEFGISTTGPEKSIYLNVLKKTGIHRNTGNKYELTQPTDTALRSLWDYWGEIILNTRDDNDRISLDLLIQEACKEPYGLKKGLAHILSIIKLFSGLDQISVYKKKNMGEEFRYLPKIQKDSMELLIKHAENFELKYVDSKIHQSLFSELYQYFNHEKKDITTLLDVAKSIIDKVDTLKERTIKTRIGITKYAQQFIKAVKEARSPEKLIYITIPKSLGLKPVASDKRISTEKYVNRLQDVLDEIQQFEQNIFPSIKEQIIGVWELGIKTNSTYAETKNALGEKINEQVINWIFDDKLKEFVKRSLDTDRHSVPWLESVSSHLVGKLPEKWSDDDIPVFIDQLRFMRIQYEEAEYLYINNKANNNIQNIDTVHIEEGIEKLIDNACASDEEKQLAIIKLYNKYVRSKKNN